MLVQCSEGGTAVLALKRGHVVGEREALGRASGASAQSPDG